MLLSCVNKKTLWQKQTKALFVMTDFSLASPCFKRSVPQEDEKERKKNPTGGIVWICVEITTYFRRKIYRGI